LSTAPHGGTFLQPQTRRIDGSARSFLRLRCDERRLFDLPRLYSAEAVTEEHEMSVEGKLKEAAGYAKEEAFEHGDSPEAKRKAQEGRDLRNEGRMEQGKAPKAAEPGTGK
jgi:hypothetical protein